MARYNKFSVALAIIGAVLGRAQIPTQVQAVVGCPPGTQLVPPGRDGAENPVAVYCAEAPQWGTYNRYTGRIARDPQSGFPLSLDQQPIS